MGAVAAAPLPGALRLLRGLRRRDRPAPASCGRLPRVNFIEDVVERFPGGAAGADRGRRRRRAARPPLRRALRPLGGPLGRLRRPRRRARRRRHDPDRQPAEWVLAMLACWRMGAVVLPCNPQLRREDLELRARVRRRALRRRGRLPGRAARRDPLHGHGRPRRGSSTRTASRRPRPRSPTSRLGPGGDRLHLGHDRRAARRRLSAALPRRPGRPGEALVRRPGRGDRLVHGGAGLGEVDPQLLHRALVPGRRRRPPRRPLRPGRAAAALRGARRQRPLPGADRVPDARQARRARAGRRPAPPGLRRRADRARGDPPLQGAARPADRRRLRPDRDRRDQRRPGRTGTTRPATARWAGRCPASRPAWPRTASCSFAPPPPPPSSTATSTASRFEGEWWPTGDRVREDEDGYLWFEGRNDDLILSSGYRIGPFEVESALVSHPAVAEAAAVAAPDPERGSVVRAIVVLQDGQRALRAARARSCRSTSGPRRPPTSTRASSSSRRSCRRRAAARSGGRELRGAQ